jgi:hypothetical protein
MSIDHGNFRTMTSFRVVLTLTMICLSGAAACRSCHEREDLSLGDAASDASDAGSGTTLEIENKTDAGVLVYVAFGSRSIISPQAPGWEFCTQYQTYAMVCDFQLGGTKTRDLPLAGMYFNATISFGGPVACGTTKAEFDLNSETWYDTMDLSLVDGFNAGLGALVREPGIALDAGPVMLGPVLKERGNERAFGVYPLACDICVARQGPPCGYKPGPSPECKKGKQSDPDVPCQYQGTAMHGADTGVKLVYFGMLNKEVLHLGRPEDEVP